MTGGNGSSGGRQAMNLQGSGADGGLAISQETFEQVVNRVYAMLLLDLKIENERRRRTGGLAGRQGGS